MKKTLVLLVFLCVGLVVVFAYAQKGERDTTKIDPMAEYQKSLERGKALFSDTTLATNKMSCNTCHLEGGTKEGKMGEILLPSFDNLGIKYPNYFASAKRVMTLDQVNNWSIVNLLKGKALAWDDQRLTDLTAYVTSLRAKKIEIKE